MFCFKLSCCLKIAVINRPFPRSLVPLFQNESKCETFHMKMSFACSFIFMQIKVIFIRMVSHLDSFWNRGARELGNGLLKLHGGVCSPFWILTVEWSGARSCLFWWRRRLKIASFSPSTLENSVFKKHRFQIAPLWRAFSNGSVFGDRFRRCSVNDSRIRRYPEQNSSGRFRLKTD